MPNRVSSHEGAKRRHCIVTPTGSSVLVDIPALAAGLRKWIVEGPCRGTDGAYHAWVDESDGSVAYAYPEITGYALTWLASHAEPSAEERRSAEAAGDWLIGRFASGDWSARTGMDDGASLVFDLGMIATGLLTAAGRFGNDSFLAQGREIVGLIVGQQQREGLLTSLSDRSPVRKAARPAWSTEGYAHLVKVVQCLLLGAEANCDGARESADAVIGHAARFQDDDGRFVTHQRTGETMLHPHLYAAEGLYAYGMARGDKSALERSRAATVWAWEQQQESGALPRFVYPSTSRFARRSADRAPGQADLTMQGIRMAFAHDTRPDGLDRALEWVHAMAHTTSYGIALPYQSPSTPVHLNTWVTLFGAQALELGLADAAPLSWRHLV
jgi:hypothetical protein